MFVLGLCPLFDWIIGLNHMSSLHILDVRPLSEVLLGKSVLPLQKFYFVLPEGFSFLALLM